MEGSYGIVQARCLRSQLEGFTTEAKRGRGERGTRRRGEEGKREPEGQKTGKANGRKLRDCAGKMPALPVGRGRKIAIVSLDSSLRWNDKKCAISRSDHLVGYGIMQARCLRSQLVEVEK
jgi:hypothetical protein